jgi:acetyl esterase/lipase
MSERPIDPTALLDPEIRDLLAALPPMGPVTADSLEATRAIRRAMVAGFELSEQVERRTLTVPGPAGGPDVELHLRRPRGVDGALPCVLWIHGGGYVSGIPEQDDLRFDRWCTGLGIAIVAVRYRLAPEHPFPAGLDDCVAGLSWVLDHASEIGVDPSRVGVGGASAGGGLAAGLALVARDRGMPVGFQVLVYPMIDDRLGNASHTWEVPIWPPASNRFGWQSYLGELYGTDRVPPEAAPARAADLHGLPPAIIVVGTLDGFLDEDLDYAGRLARAGVPVELHVYPGAPHGFESFAPSSAIARRCHRDLADWLARVIRPGT